MDAERELFELELKSKQICRFCLTQNEVLSNIYSRENRLLSSAPLPLQIMSCVSIEAYTNDGMPNTICDNCRMLMEHCYRFKQMCKKADTLLRQYPLTGVWPKQLDIPKLSEDVIFKMYPHFNQTRKIIASTQTDRYKRMLPVKIYNLPISQPSTSAASIQQSSQRPPKLLNKNSMKILNKDAQKNSEPILSQPVIKRDSAGNIEVVTEIIEQYIDKTQNEVDPIKNAVPVETDVFPCPHCERSFPLRQLLDIHLVNHNRKRSFECNICAKRFFSKYDLGKHVLIHTGEKPYECVVCKKAFTRSTLLHRHEKVHTDQPKFLCVFCEKPFLSKEELDKHTERHKKSRPFSCKICSKSFAFKQGLERHETVHAKNQPYPCQYCDYSFSTPSKLARHLTAHAGDRPFPCKLCPKSYLLSHHLTRHLRSHKQGSGSYKCFDCEKIFTTRDDLIYHSAVHATQTLICPLCKEQFEDLDCVTEHIKNHAEGEQYACEFCDLIFMTAEKLQAHSNTEHLEDLVAYEEHDKSIIIKGENDQNFTDDSQESVHGNEIFEEYIIEMDDFESDQQEMKKNDVVIGKDIVITRKIDDKNETISYEVSGDDNALNQDPDSFKTSKIISTMDDYGCIDMKIETINNEKLSGEKYETINEESVDEPARKILKLDSISHQQHSLLRKKLGDTISQSTNINKLTEKRKLNQQSVSPSKKPGNTQSTTKYSILKQSQKTVTIVKKNNSPSGIPDAVQNKPRVLNSIKIISRSGSKNNSNTTDKTAVNSEKPKQNITETSTSFPQMNEASLHKKSNIPSTENKEKKTSIPASSPQSSTENSHKKESPKSENKLIEMVLGDRKVKVQKIMMTKSEVAKMAKEGKIEMKEGAIILRQDDKNIIGKVMTRSRQRKSEDNSNKVVQIKESN